MPDVSHLRIQLATIGLRGMARLALRNRLRRTLRTYGACRRLLAGARGLEIGGPSAIFARGGILPVYALLEALDDCDFAGTTIWHGEGAEGTPFVYDPERPPGWRMVREATALTGIGDGAYDVVLSSHTLEHVADPLLALAEWRRVVGPRGYLLLVVPHFEHTVDHRRPATTLEHLEADLEHSTPEDDATHVEEFLRLADLTRDPELRSQEGFEERTRAYLDNRTVHHHVFDTELVVRVLDRASFRILSVEPTLPFHVVALAQAADRPDNGPFLARSAPWRRSSPFKRDRRSAA